MNKDCHCKKFQFNCKPLSDNLSKDEIVKDLTNFTNAFANCNNEIFQYVGNCLYFEVKKNDCICKPEYHDGAFHQLVDSLCYMYKYSNK